MKKIVLCLGLVALSLNSCSSDDSGTSTDDGGATGVLVKAMSYQDDSGGPAETVEYTYNGSKLAQGVYNDGSVEIYTYSGDLITEIEVTNNGQVTYRDTFTYDPNGRLITYVYEDLEDDWTETETFVYNSNGTVTSNYDGLVTTREFENGEVMQAVQTGYDTYDYVYDGKNSSFKNVTGYDKIAYVHHGDHEFYGAKQNIVSIHNATSNTNYMTNTTTYNAANYPTLVTSVAEFDSEGTHTATMQYSYF